VLLYTFLCYLIPHLLLEIPASFYDDFIQQVFLSEKLLLLTILALDMMRHLQQFTSILDDDDNYDDDEYAFGHPIIDDDEEPYVRKLPKVGRNDACPCGSGKKFKKCCMDKS